MNFIPKYNAEEVFPRSASIRGAYINSGSRDVGPDRTYRGEVLPIPPSSRDE